jgi:hypothetical protein
MAECCKTGYLHSGDPKGTWGTLGSLKTYFTGDQNSPRALLFLHDGFGPTLPNNQLLAGPTFLVMLLIGFVDTYAEKLDARVFIPDFFQGTHLPFDYFSDDRVRLNAGIDLPKFLEENNRPNRLPDILQAIKDIQALPGVLKLGTIGVCIQSLTEVLLGRMGFPRCWVI